MAGQNGKIRVALNGYGVIGKRVADAVACQDDMELVGIADIATDWRLRVVTQKGFKLFAALDSGTDAIQQAGLRVAGGLDALLGDADIVVDCTPKRIGAKNAEHYRRLGIKFIMQGGEKHEITGHSFVAEASYASAVGRQSTRIAKSRDRKSVFMRSPIRMAQPYCSLTMLNVIMARPHKMARNERHTSLPCAEYATPPSGRTRFIVRPSSKAGRKCLMSISAMMPKPFALGDAGRLPYGLIESDRQDLAEKVAMLSLP